MRLPPAATAIALGIDAAKAATALNASRGVRGRSEVLYHGAFTILCDFAHTGDAIEKVLAGLAPFVQGRLIVLFGCAGERDAQKRPLMSKAVVKYADFAILTSDNPRKENPYDIIKDAEPVLAASKNEVHCRGGPPGRPLQGHWRCCSEGDVLGAVRKRP